jgi:Domain of unknown function (DUF4164)
MRGSRGEVAVTDASEIEAAAGRLQDALIALESAVERRIDHERGHASLASQVDVFDADRARLAAELDGAVARSRRLEAANREVARRLDEAIETIRAVLEPHNRQG